MDSLNLSEAQNTTLNSKNTACNTAPIACAFCGSKYYIQILPQPYCYRVQYPDIPRCKHGRENSEENFINPQPVFSPFPLPNSFFPNNPFLLNSCFAHNHLDDEAKNKEKKEYSTKSGNEPHLPNQNCFCQKENNLSGNKTMLNEGTQKYSNAPGLGQSFNLMDPHSNSVFQQCGWGDFIPWTCSPFIAPMISYCLFWNSQKLGANTLPNCATEHVCQKYNENLNQTNSSPKNNNEKEFQKSFVREYDNKNSKTQINNSQEDGLEVEDYENYNQSIGNTTSDYSPEENNFKEVEKKEDLVEYSKTSSDSLCGGEGEEDAEMEGFDSAVQVESDEFLKTTDKILYDAPSCLSIEPHKNLKNNRSQSEMSDVTFGNTNDNVNASETQGDSSDAEDENTFITYPDESKQKPLMTESGNCEERISTKKAFKNFTIADQTNDTVFEDGNMSVAAAGDLGGENCVGYKVTIVPYEKEDEDKSYKETEAEGSESSESILQDTEPTKIHKPTVIVKTPNESIKSPRNFKSGIAKYSNNSKLKEVKPDTGIKSKLNRESNIKESGLTKPRHNCLTSNNDSVSKQTKNCPVSPHPVSEKQSKRTPVKPSPNKKDKRLQRTKSER